MRYIGIDPGPTPGVVVLEVDSDRLWEADVLQCTARLLLPIALELVRGRPARVAIEQFVVRGRIDAVQSLTRDQVTTMQQSLKIGGATVVLRPAVQVKAWATDARLRAVRPVGQDPTLLDLCKGMRHARDAARHALYAAVHDGALPDPLSKEWVR